MLSVREANNKFHLINRNVFNRHDLITIWDVDSVKATSKNAEISTLIGGEAIPK